MKHPIDTIQWVRRETVTPNAYNPNRQASPEHALLVESIVQDGWTQALVVRPAGDGKWLIIDGAHRYLASGDKRIRQRDSGMVPVVVLDVASDAAIASTIRHNRARGTHSVQRTSDIIRELSERGWSDKKISKNLGMAQEEIDRLRVADDLPGVLSGMDKFMSPS